MLAMIMMFLLHHGESPLTNFIFLPVGGPRYNFLFGTHFTFFFCVLGFLPWLLALRPK